MKKKRTYIKKFKDTLGRERLSYKKFYRTYVNPTGLGYSLFCKDLETMYYSDCNYIEKPIDKFMENIDVKSD